MLIIGITGTLGAGKGTIVEYLVDQKGFVHFSVRDFLIEEIQKRQLPLNRDSMTRVANDLRKQNAPSYIVDQLYKKAAAHGRNCIIESIRTPGEIYALQKQANFSLFAIDASPKTRYQRILLRNSVTDQVSYDTFLMNEQREMESTDPNHQNLKKCIELADFRFQNEDSREALYAEVENVLQQIQS